MTIVIPVEFEVDTNDEDVAIEAAEQAVQHYLAFTTITDVNPGRDECTVHVDGYGKVTVRIP